MAEGIVLFGRVVRLVREETRVMKGENHVCRCYLVGTADYQRHYIDTVDCELTVDPDEVQEIPVYVNVYYSEKKKAPGYNLRYSQDRAA